MAKNSPTPGGGTPTPSGPCPITEKCFTDFVTAAADRQTDAANAAASLEIIFKGKLSDVCDERRNHDKAQETLTLYTNIQFCHVTTICKDIEQGQATVVKKTEQAAEAKKGYDKVLENLKALKGKLTTVKTLTGAFETVICDNCNSESRKAIEEKMGGAEALNNYVGALKTMAVEAENATDQANETAIITAGILAFTNVASIKPFTDDLKAKCDVFKKDVEENLKNTAKTIETNQKALNEALVQLSDTEANWRRSKTVPAGIKQTIADVNSRTVLTPPMVTPFEDIPVKVKQAVSGSLPKPAPAGKPVAA